LDERACISNYVPTYFAPQFDASTSSDSSAPKLPSLWVLGAAALLQRPVSELCLVGIYEASWSGAEVADTRLRLVDLGVGYPSAEVLPLVIHALKQSKLTSI
jgi:hypothetical protein